MVTSFRRTYASSQDWYIQCPWPWGRPRLTHSSAGDSWTITGKPGSVSCGITAPFSWVLRMQGFFVPSKSPFPPSCGTSVIKSHWPSKSNSVWVSVPLLVGKSVLSQNRPIYWSVCLSICQSSSRKDLFLFSNFIVFNFWPPSPILPTSCPCLC